MLELRFEIGVLVALVIVAIAAPTRLSVVWRTVLRLAGRAARRRRSAVIAMAAIGALGAAGVAAWRAPVPSVHDEFSYLLAADTFANARLANPAPPSPEHFESFHILVEPTYGSKYPPGQGLALAAGQRLGGDPALGLWLSIGLLTAATLWMLQGWFPPRWALLGAVIVLLRYGLASYWAQSFWGGALAAAAGALVFGALPRLVRHGRGGAALACGIGLLAISRPYEGLLVTLVAACVIAWGWRRGRFRARAVVIPGLIVLVPVAGFTALLNDRVTGSPLRMPYQEHDARYASTPAFIWQDAGGGPPPRLEVSREFWRVEDERHARLRTFRGFLDESRAKLRDLRYFYLRRFLGVFLLLSLPFLLRDRRVRASCGALLPVLGGILLSTFCRPHYAAPVTCLIIVLVVAALRRCTAQGRRGASVAAIAFLGLVGLTVLDIRAHVGARSTWADERLDLEERLTADPDRHLLLVRYGPLHTPHYEWVYNGADVTGQDVVWARDLGDGNNERLIAAFPGRRVWRVEVGFDDRVHRLVPLR